MSETDTNPTPRRGLSVGTWIAIGVPVVLLLVGLLLQFVVFPNSVTSDGNNLQKDLNKAASTAWGQLDGCVQKTARAAQVATAQTDALSKILKDAVSGRYGQGSELDKTKVFSALQEAYPEQATAGLNRTFDNAMATMVGCQDDFLKAQGAMNGKANDFVGWQTGSWFVRTYGGDKFPTDNLKVVVGREVLATGATALEWMQSVIVEVDTANSIEQGTRSGSTSANNNPFGNPTTPAPQPSSTR